MKSIDIIITTWPRYPERNKYLEEVLISLRKNLLVDKFKTRWIISSETQGISIENKKELHRISNDHSFELYYHNGPANLGANLNFAHSLSKGDYIIYVQDDFKCTEPIDVSIDINFFDTHPAFKLIRYYWRESTLPREKITEHHYHLSKKCRNYYSDNPHIKTKDFHSIVGEYVTTDNSRCEHAMNDSAKRSSINLAMRRTPSDPETPRTRFTHIGHTSSMTEKWFNHPKNVAKRKAENQKI